MSTTPERKEFTDNLKVLRKELSDYAKAMRAEARKRPKYFRKDSDQAGDKLRDAFEIFVRTNIR